MTTIFTIIILSIVILGLCFAGLAITMIIKKNGKFPETEIGHNKNMQQLGIRCAKQEELCSGCQTPCAQLPTLNS
ncbi:MAG: hypothetical protein LBF39_02820 [Prevotellaceae bacterium]|nr:hypothetical protein [Prevotellaceae bacterium]